MKRFSIFEYCRERADTEYFLNNFQVAGLYIQVDKNESETRAW